MNRCKPLAAVAAVVCPLSAVAAETLVDLSKQTFEGATAAPAGQRFDLDMGEKRVNWTNARWSVVKFEQPKNLAAFRGVKVSVTTDKPRADAGVYLAVKESDGSWYYLPWAANLTQASNTGTALFADFTTADYMSPPGGSHFDENGKLDLDQISAVAVGCVNPLGVGKVSFAVTSLELLPAEKTQIAPVSVQVNGKLLDVNGTTMLPAGLFGGFNLREMDAGGKKMARVTRYRLAQDRRINPPGPTMGDAVTTIMINTIGDRVGPSMRLTNPKWEEAVTASGTKFGEKAKETGKTVYVEWWNEPYLNWANINRKNFDPKFYDESKAAEGGPVTLKIDGSEMPFLKWTQKFPVPGWNWCDTLQQFRRGKDAKGNWSLPYATPYGGGWNPTKWRASCAISNPPDDVKDGQTYKVDNKGKMIEYTALTPWTVYDETQFTYWSGKGMLKPYIDPMIAFGKAFKAAGGKDAFYIAGWGNRPSEDHWAGFKQVYQPTIDAAPDLIDGICDHDYGGAPVKMPASYELITAYGVTKYKKWLTSWNTETAMGGDPQAYPQPEGAAPGSQIDQQKFRWTVTKLIHALQTVPDKARSFAWFGIDGGWFTDSGEGVAMDMLRNLRGRLVQITTSDPFVYAAAAVDGTDPANVRPADMADRKELVVAVVNDNLTARACEFVIKPPPGFQFAGLIIRQPVIEPSGAIKIEQKEEKVAGDAYTLKRELAPRSIVSFTFPLTGALKEEAPVTRKQFFSPQILSEVTPAKPLATTIAADASSVKSGKHAWLRIVAERLDHGEGSVSINGKAYALPAAITPENTPYVRDVAIDVKDLKESNDVQFTVSGPGHAGYLIAAASVFVESE